MPYPQGGVGGCQCSPRRLGATAGEHGDMAQGGEEIQEERDAGQGGQQHEPLAIEYFHWRRRLWPVRQRIRHVCGVPCLRGCLGAEERRCQGPSLFGRTAELSLIEAETCTILRHMCIKQSVQAGQELGTVEEPLEHTMTLNVK